MTKKNIHFFLLSSILTYIVIIEDIHVYSTKIIYIIFMINIYIEKFKMVMYYNMLLMEINRILDNVSQYYHILGMSKKFRIIENVKLKQIK